MEEEAAVATPAAAAAGTLVAEAPDTAVEGVEEVGSSTTLDKS